jgi:hypothetical protein
MGSSGDYECVDIDNDLNSCGGCTSTGAGKDCTAIPGAFNVACTAGACEGKLYSLSPYSTSAYYSLLVYTCTQGYQLSADQKSCIKL